MSFKYMDCVAFLLTVLKLLFYILNSQGEKKSFADSNFDCASFSFYCTVQSTMEQTTNEEPRE